jgi:hypothetical protein
VGGKKDQSETRKIARIAFRDVNAAQKACMLHGIPMKNSNLCVVPLTQEKVE